MKGQSEMPYGQNSHFRRKNFPEMKKRKAGICRLFVSLQKELNSVHQRVMIHLVMVFSSSLSLVSISLCSSSVPSSSLTFGLVVRFL